MCPLLYAPCLGLALMFSLAPAPASGEPQLPAGQAGLLDASGIPKEILDLLDKTRKAYGPDAALLQVQLLQHAIYADSILPASVQVNSIRVHDNRHYLLFELETGIVFHSERVDRRSRVSRLWSGVVIPALGRLDTYDMPGDGIAVEIEYFHRPYKDADELQDTVRLDHGSRERVTFHISYPDALAFRRRELDASLLYSRSRACVDHVLFEEPLPTNP